MQLSTDIAAALGIPTADVDARVTAQYLTGVYTLYPQAGAVERCTLQTEIAFCATLVIELALPDPSYATCERVKGATPAAQDRVKFFPRSLREVGAGAGNRRLSEAVADPAGDLVAGSAAEGVPGEVGSEAGAVGAAAGGHRRLLTGAGAGWGGALGAAGGASQALGTHEEERVQLQLVREEEEEGEGEEEEEAFWVQLAGRGRHSGSWRAGDVLEGHELTDHHDDVWEQEQQQGQQGGVAAGWSALTREAVRLGHQAAKAAAAADVRRRQLQGGGAAPCYVAARILIANETNNVQFVLDLFTKNIAGQLWQVVPPAAGNVTQSSSLDLLVRNPRGSARQQLIVFESQLTSVIAGSLGLQGGEVAVERPGVVERIPGGGRRCPSPRLGVLCGADAVGAIVGIALGGTIVLCLALMAFLYSRRGRMGKVVVLDDFAWARKYAHIVPTNVVASPYVTQYGAADGTNVMYK